MRRNSMPTHAHCWRRLNKLTHSSTLFSSTFSVSSSPFIFFFFLCFIFSFSSFFSAFILSFLFSLLFLPLLPPLIPLLLLLQSRCEAEVVFKNISETLQQHNTTGTHNKHTLAANKGCPAKDGGKSPSADLLQLLKMTLSSFQDRQEAAERQVPTTLT